jgi:CHAT domain-containing protein
MKLKRGEIPAALQESDLALQRFPSKETEWYWRFRVLKAEILDVQGREREALDLLQEELPPSFATSEVAVRRKYTQASANASLRLLKEADGDLAEAQALAKGYHPEVLGEVALIYGTVQFMKGAAAAAEAAYKQARELAREEKDPFLEAAALSGLGVATTMEGHYDESIDWNRAAAELARTVGATGSLARTLGNTGWSYAELGDYENALTFYKQAEQMSARSGLEAGQTYWLTAIAWAHQGLGDDASAEAILKQALPLARKQDDKGTLAQCLNQLTWIALGTGKTDLAEGYNQEALDVAARGLGSRLLIDAMLLRGLIRTSKHDYKDGEKFLKEVIGEPQASKFQQWKAQAELANVYAAEGSDEKAEKEYRVSLATIEEVRKSIQSAELRLTFLFNTIRFYSNFVDFLMSRQRIEDALQVAELSRARTLEEGLGTVSKTLSFPLQGFHPQRIARRRNAVLLDYWLGPQQSYLWVITPTKIRSFQLAKQSEVEALVNEYRGAMQGGKDLLAGGGVAGQKLYSMLIEPAQEWTPRNAHVIVLPDASLYRLNFETLIARDPKPHYWIEDVTLSTASSLTLLDSTATAFRQKDRSLLLIGNTEQPSSDFPALSQAPKEMRNTERYFPDSRRRVLEGKQATPKAYLENNPERFSYIHFVTHGTASVTHPLESAVILSADGDSYKLYARDIVQHHINADIVTISACNGAGARPYSGEGLVGLSWAFIRAGAHNVISALWEVSDASAPELMDALYRGLSQGKDPATALREAKLSLLHSPEANSVFKKPFYWAPFQLYAGR